MSQMPAIRLAYNDSSAAWVAGYAHATISTIEVDVDITTPEQMVA